MHRILYSILSLLLTIVPITAAQAQQPSAADAAAVVISFDSDTYVVRTVPLPAEGTLNGMELLQASGLTIIDNYGLICKIGSVGCDYPESDCICQMPDYWSYWLYDGTGWNYSGKGAAGHILEAGDIDGWAWGRGTRKPPIPVAAEIFDADRIAPGPAHIVDEGDAVSVRIAFQADANGSAEVVVVASATQGQAAEISLPVTREEDQFVADASALAAGKYAITATITDPDGINGRAVWQLELEIAAGAGDHVLQLPFVCSITWPASPSAYNCQRCPIRYTR